MIFSKSVKSKQGELESSSSVDHLFSFEEARIAYKNLLKFVVDKKDETTISILIGLNAFIHRRSGLSTKKYKTYKSF